MFYIFGAVLLFILDQITTLLTVQNFSLYESVTVIKGVLDFTRHHNTGGPWSLFDSHIEVFVIITFVIFLLEFLYFKKRPMKHPLEKISVMLINAGAIGNLFDRIFRGYVVDMIEVTFIEYPVFNFADICVVSGAILFCIYMFFDKSEKSEK